MGLPEEALRPLAPHGLEERYPSPAPGYTVDPPPPKTKQPATPDQDDAGVGLLEPKHSRPDAAQTAAMDWQRERAEPAHDRGVAGAGGHAARVEGRERVQRPA